MSHRFAGANLYTLDEYNKFCNKKITRICVKFSMTAKKAQSPTDKRRKNR